MRLTPIVAGAAALALTASPSVSLLPLSLSRASLTRAG